MGGQVQDDNNLKQVFDRELAQTESVQDDKYFNKV
jgi:hypothetical protein